MVRAGVGLKSKFCKWPGWASRHCNCIAAHWVGRSSGGAAREQAASRTAPLLCCLLPLPNPACPPTSQHGLPVLGLVGHAVARLLQHAHPLVEKRLMGGEPSGKGQLTSRGGTPYETMNARGVQRQTETAWPTHSREGARVVAHRGAAGRSPRRRRVDQACKGGQRSGGLGRLSDGQRPLPHR